MISATGLRSGRPRLVTMAGVGRILTSAPSAVAVDVTPAAVVRTSEVDLPRLTSRVLVLSTLDTSCSSEVVIGSSGVPVLVSGVSTWASVLWIGSWLSIVLALRSRLATRTEAAGMGQATVHWRASGCTPCRGSRSRTAATATRSGRTGRAWCRCCCRWWPPTAGEATTLGSSCPTPFASALIGAVTLALETPKVRS